MNNNRYTVYTAIIIALAVLCIIGLIILVGIRSNPDNPADTTSNIASQTTADNGTTTADNIPSSVMLSPTADMGQEYLDKIIFFGDSTTAHMIYFEALSGGKNTKQVWKTTQDGTLMLNVNIAHTDIIYPDTGETIKITEAVSRKKPEYMVITLGINGVSSLTESNFKLCYKKLINAVIENSPDTKIILQSIFPVTKKYSDDSSKNITNAKIDTANRWVLDIAAELNLKYLDTASVLKDSAGGLKEELNSYHLDGIHINKDGYKLVTDYIRTHGYSN